MYAGLTPAPDSSFVRQLRLFDKDLKVEFDRKLELFVITQSRYTGGRVLALVIASDTDTYRQPDARDIRILYMADFYRRNVKQRILEGEEYMRKVREDQDISAEDDIRHLTRDSKRQLANAYTKAFNLGKGVTGFRQVPAHSH